MKLFKAIKWYLFEYRPTLEMIYATSQLEKMVGGIVIAFIACLYFLGEGLLLGNTKQIWASSLGILAALLPIFIFSMSLLGIYDENHKDDSEAET